MEHLKYPTGRFKMPESDLSITEIKDYVKRIEDFPSRLRESLKGASARQLEAVYRPEGWTVRQVVHHCADSHLNSFLRFKLALTEVNPRITSYDEGAWAEMSDVTGLTIEPSLLILEGVHARWAFFMHRMDYKDWQRGYFHPEKNRIVALSEAVALYAWHGDHHLGHVKLAMEQG